MTKIQYRNNLILKGINITNKFMKILYIEDETRIGKYVKKGLEKNGFAVDWSENGKNARNYFNENNYDCIVLDLNLPDCDGLELAKEFRNTTPNIPIIMLSARTSQEEIIQGFQSGTDDYLVKPFDFTELILRMNALIRRSAKSVEDIIQIDDFIFNKIDRSIKLKDKIIELNNKELGILEYLLHNRGKTISQEELLEHVWDREVNIFTDTVRTNIKTLRKKIDPDKKIIITYKGRGYVIK